jgi:hypothetical protein
MLLCLNTTLISYGISFLKKYILHLIHQTFWRSYTQVHSFFRLTLVQLLATSYLKPG